MYHQVAEPLSVQERRFCMPPIEFAKQMTYLVQGGYTPVSLAELDHCLRGTRDWPPRPVHVTFDDGFRGVLEHAWPVLERHRIPATLFVVSGLMGATNEWMQQRGFPSRPLLSREELIALAQGGLAIGSHTRRHPRLSEVSAAAAASEITDSKRELEDLLQREVRYFAYPYGAFTPAVREQVAAADYTAACATVSGFNRPGEDPYALRRIDVFGTDRLWQFRQKLRYGRNESSLAFPVRYYGQRLMRRLGLAGA